MNDYIEFTVTKKPIYEVIGSANKFIKIVAFQLTSQSIINLLLKKAKENVNIEIITLPEDSFADVKARTRIREMYQTLKKNNIRLYICDWEVGEPKQTQTSQSGDISEGGGTKWYSLHGKFIVTEKNALIMSSNLTDEPLWEVYLVTSDEEHISLFISKFNYLKELFILKSSPIPVPHARIIEVISLFFRILTNRAFSTLIILPLKGKIA